MKPKETTNCVKLEEYLYLFKYKVSLIKNIQKHIFIIYGIVDWPNISKSIFKN